MKIIMKKIILGLVALGTNAAAQPPSLANQGNSCYANGLIQSWYNMPDLTGELIADKEKIRQAIGTKLIADKEKIRQAIGTKLIADSRDKGEETKKEDEQKIKSYIKLVEVYTELVEKIMQRKNKLRTFSEELVELYANVIVPYFGGSGQQDMPELMDFFINAMEDVPALKKLYFETQQAILCQDYIVATQDGAHFLQLNLADTLSEAFALYFARETIEYNGQMCEKNISLASAPEYLIIQLQRAQWDAEKNKPYKNEDPIEVPPTFTIEKNYIKDAQESIDYALISVVVHTGTTSCGHYYAYIKDLYHSDQSWYNCNDDIITPVNFDNVHNDINKGYVFFYARPSVLAEAKKRAEQKAAVEEAEKNLDVLARALSSITV